MEEGKTKPPIGVVPKEIWEWRVKKNRALDLLSGIQTRLQENMLLKEKWVEELNSVLLQLPMEPKPWHDFWREIPFQLVTPITPEHFGAVADGETDNTQAIKNYVDYMTRKERMKNG